MQCQQSCYLSFLPFHTLLLPIFITFTHGTGLNGVINGSPGNLAWSSFKKKLCESCEQQSVKEKTQTDPETENFTTSWKREQEFPIHCLDLNTFRLPCVGQRGMKKMTDTHTEEPYRKAGVTWVVCSMKVKQQPETSGALFYTGAWGGLLSVEDLHRGAVSGCSDPRNRKLCLTVFWTYSF